LEKPSRAVRRLAGRLRRADEGGMRGRRKQMDRSKRG